jgi:hypothetical protein
VFSSSIGVSEGIVSLGSSSEEESDPEPEPDPPPP